MNNALRKPVPIPSNGICSVAPIRMNAAMIEQIDNGTKRATRRIVAAGNSKVEPGQFRNVDLETGRARRSPTESCLRARCEFAAGERVVTISSLIQPAALLWVRKGQAGSTRASSRHTLYVRAVDVSRLHDMTEADAIEEGFQSRAHFNTFWRQMYGRGSWNPNPWVWIYRFTLHRLNVDKLLPMMACNDAALK